MVQKALRRKLRFGQDKMEMNSGASYRRPASMQVQNKELDRDVKFQLIVAIFRVYSFEQIRQRVKLLQMQTSHIMCIGNHWYLFVFIHALLSHTVFVVDLLHSLSVFIQYIAVGNDLNTPFVLCQFDPKIKRLYRFYIRVTSFTTDKMVPVVASSTHRTNNVCINFTYLNFATFSRLKGK